MRIKIFRCYKWWKLFLNVPFPFGKRTDWQELTVSFHVGPILESTLLIEKHLDHLIFHKWTLWQVRPEAGKRSLYALPLSQLCKKNRKGMKENLCEEKLACFTQERIFFLKNATIHSFMKPKELTLPRMLYVTVKRGCFFSPRVLAPDFPRIQNVLKI